MQPTYCRILPTTAVHSWPRGVGAADRLRATCHVTPSAGNAPGGSRRALLSPDGSRPWISSLTRGGRAHPRCATPATNAAARVVPIAGAFIPILHRPAVPARPFSRKRMPCNARTLKPPRPADKRGARQPPCGPNRSPIRPQRNPRPALVGTRRFVGDRPVSENQPTPPAASMRGTSHRHGWRMDPSRTSATPSPPSHHPNPALRVCRAHLTPRGDNCGHLSSGAGGGGDRAMRWMRGRVRTPPSAPVHALDARVVRSPQQLPTPSWADACRARPGRRASASHARPTRSAVRITRSTPHARASGLETA